MRVGKHLAVACLLFGLGVAAFVSGSLEQRIGNLFCVGLIPAVGFYAGGHILGQLLMFGVELCDMIMAHLLSVCRAFGKPSLELGRHARLDAKPAELTPGTPFSQLEQQNFTFLATDLMKVKARVSQ
jgi:hypothetical protein